MKVNQGPLVNQKNGDASDAYYPTGFTMVERQVAPVVVV